jgi:hypothetical protein
MAKGIMLDNEGDIRITDGLVVGNTDQQNAELLLLTNKGDLKYAPTIGVGLKDYLSSPLTYITRAKLENVIGLQVEKDGGIIKELEMKPDGTLQLEVTYG